MLFQNSGKVLLVSPTSFSMPVLAGKKVIRHVTALDRVFPAIHEEQPNIIVFDYDHYRDGMEKFLLRLRGNKFYNKIKVYCYKTDVDQRTDAYLRELGADFVVYKTESTVTNIAPASTENIEPYEPKTRTMEPIVKAYEPTYNHSFEPAFTVLTVNSYN
jgi:hypothetical protein